MPTLTRSPDCISDLTFDRSFARELAVAEQQALDAHVASCVRCSLRRDVLQTQRAAYHERVPTWQTSVARSRRRLVGRIGAISGVVLAAAAALLIVFMPKAELAAVRSKGGGQLGVFIKHGEQVTRARSGDVVKRGDVLRMTYTSPRRSQFALLHRDARKASIYYPLAERTQAIEPGRDVPLDFGIELDSLPGEERLFALFCDQPTLLEPLRAALEAAGELRSSAHCQVDTMTLSKQLEQYRSTSRADLDEGH